MSRKGSNPSAAGLRFALAVSRFNQAITDRLLSAARETLLSAGARPEDLEIYPVPGAFELPLAAQRLAQTKRFHAVICLGAVIRGETPHFDFIAVQASQGIGQAALNTGVPIIFGVLTTDTLAQAAERAAPLRGGRGRRTNRGREAAFAAVEMARLMGRIDQVSRSEGSSKALPLGLAESAAGGDKRSRC